MMARCLPCKGTGWKNPFRRSDGDCAACKGVGQIEIVGESGAWKTVACQKCGTEMRYQEHPMIPGFIPTHCSPCHKKLTDEVRVKETSEEMRVALSQLPFLDWDKSRAKPNQLALMAKVWKLVFNGKLSTTPMNLFIYGASGAGKTRCLSECAKRAISVGEKVLWVSSSIWMREWSARLANSTENASAYLDGIVRFRGTLVIDDVGVGKRTGRTDELVYELCDRRLNNSFPTWFTSNMDPNALETWFEKDYGPRIVRRLCDACQKIDTGTV